MFDGITKKDVMMAFSFLQPYDSATYILIYN